MVHWRGRRASSRPTQSTRMPAVAATSRSRPRAARSTAASSWTTTTMRGKSRGSDRDIEQGSEHVGDRLGPDREVVAGEGRRTPIGRAGSNAATRTSAAPTGRAGPRPRRPRGRVGPTSWPSDRAHGAVDEHRRRRGNRPPPPGRGRGPRGHPSRLLLLRGDASSAMRRRSASPPWSTSTTSRDRAAAVPTRTESRSGASRPRAHSEARRMRASSASRSRGGRARWRSTRSSSIATVHLVDAFVEHRQVPGPIGAEAASPPPPLHPGGNQEDDGGEERDEQELRTAEHHGETDAAGQRDHERRDGHPARRGRRRRSRHRVEGPTPLGHRPVRRPVERHPTGGIDHIGGRQPSDPERERPDRQRRSPVELRTVEVDPLVAIAAPFEGHGTEVVDLDDDRRAAEDQHPGGPRRRWLSRRCGGCRGRAPWAARDPGPRRRRTRRRRAARRRGGASTASQTLAPDRSPEPATRMSSATRSPPSSHSAAPLGTTTSRAMAWSASARRRSPTVAVGSTSAAAVEAGSLPIAADAEFEEQFDVGRLRRGSRRHGQPSTRRSPGGESSVPTGLGSSTTNSVRWAGKRCSDTSTTVPLGVVADPFDHQQRGTDGDAEDVGVVDRRPRRHRSSGRRVRSRPGAAREGGRLDVVAAQATIRDRRGTTP